MPDSKSNTTPRQCEHVELRHHFGDDDDECWMCGGSGELLDTCTCGDDTCCCLYPEPEPCPECAT